MAELAEVIEDKYPSLTLEEKELARLALLPHFDLLMEHARLGYMNGDNPSFEGLEDLLDITVKLEKTVR